MNLKQNILQHVIGIVISCGENMIELGKKDKKYQAKINGKQLMLIH